jgi:hypothetical protein
MEYMTSLLCYSLIYDYMICFLCVNEHALFITHRSRLESRLTRQARDHGHLLVCQQPKQDKPYNLDSSPLQELSTQTDSVCDVAACRL